MHVCTYVYTNECVHICMCFHRLPPRILQLQLSVFIWFGMRGYMDIYTYIYKCIHICMYIVYICMYMYVYVHLHIYVYVYICICI